MSCSKSSYRFEISSLSCLKIALAPGSSFIQLRHALRLNGELGCDHFICTTIMSLLHLAPPLYQEAGWLEFMAEPLQLTYLCTYLQCLNEVCSFWLFVYGVHGCNNCEVMMKLSKEA